MDQPNYNLLVWNVRGLSSAAHRDALRGVVRDAKASVVCIQETKLSAISPFMIREMLGTRFSSFAYVPAVGACGGADRLLRPGFYSVASERGEILCFRLVASE